MKLTTLTPLFLLFGCSNLLGLDEFSNQPEGSAGVGAAAGHNAGGASGVGGAAGAASGGAAGDGGSAATGGSAGSSGAAGSAGVGGAAGDAGAAGTAGAAGAGGATDPCAAATDGTPCGVGLSRICLKESCMVSECGDGYTDSAQAEGCDDGKNGDDRDGCTDLCQVLDPKVGAPCATNTDCNDTPAGLGCTTPTDGGISNGMCTRNCVDDSDCFGHVCDQGLCKERCTFGVSGNGQSLDPNKCHGRADLGCFPTDTMSGDLDFARNRCIPLCRNDEECGPAYCDPKGGFCIGQPVAGLDYGADCSCAADCNNDDPCRGFCLGGAFGASGTCTRLCTIGDLSSGGCGSAIAGSQAGVCWNVLQFTADGALPSAPGDGLGSCEQLCDCEGECRGAERNCYSLDDLFQQPGAGQALFGRDGVCMRPDTAPGTSVLSACGN